MQEIVFPVYVFSLWENELYRLYTIYLNRCKWIMNHAFVYIKKINLQLFFEIFVAFSPRINSFLFWLMMLAERVAPRELRHILIAYFNTKHMVQLKTTIQKLIFKIFNWLKRLMHFNNNRKKTQFKQNRMKLYCFCW